MIDSSSRRARAGLVIAAHAVISFGMLLLTLTTHGGTAIDVYPLCVTLTTLSAWLILSWGLVGGAVSDAYGLFLVVLIAFNCGQAGLQVLGLNPNGLLDGKFAPDVLADALALTAASLAWLHLGALLARFLSPTRTQARAGLGCDATRRAGWLMVAVSLVPMIVSVIASLRIALASGYGALYDRDFQTGVDGYVDVLAAFVLPGIYFLAAGAGRHRIPRYTAVVLIALYTTVRLIIGYRASAVLPLIAFAWLWERQIARVGRRRIAIGALTLIMIFPLVRLTRVQSASDRADLLNAEVLAESVGNPLIDVVAETGSTLGVAAYVLELVPSERPHDLGVGYFVGLSTLVPNLFWEIHPAVATGSYTGWLIRRVNPWIDERGGSYGFSLIAEAYMNFGSVGGPLLLALLAFGFVRFVRWGEAGDPARAAALAVFLAYWLFISRAESAIVIRPLVWYAMAPYGLSLVLRRGARSSPVRTVAVHDEGIGVGPWVGAGAR